MIICGEATFVLTQEPSPLKIFPEFQRSLRLTPTHCVRCCPFCRANRRWLFGQKGNVRRSLTSRTLFILEILFSIFPEYQQKFHILIRDEVTFVLTYDKVSRTAFIFVISILSELPETPVSAKCIKASCFWGIFDIFSFAMKALCFDLL